MRTPDSVSLCLSLSLSVSLCLTLSYSVSLCHAPFSPSPSSHLTSPPPRRAPDTDARLLEAFPTAAQKWYDRQRITLPSPADVMQGMVQFAASFFRKRFERKRQRLEEFLTQAALGTADALAKQEAAFKLQLHALNKSNDEWTETMRRDVVSAERAVLEQRTRADAASGRNVDLRAARDRAQEEVALLTAQLDKAHHLLESLDSGSAPGFGKSAHKLAFLGTLAQDRAASFRAASALELKAALLARTEAVSQLQETQRALRAAQASVAALTTEVEGLRRNKAALVKEMQKSRTDIVKSLPSMAMPTPIEDLSTYMAWKNKMHAAHAHRDTHALPSAAAKPSSRPASASAVPAHLKPTRMPASSSAPRRRKSAAAKSTGGTAAGAAAAAPASAAPPTNRTRAYLRSALQAHLDRMEEQNKLLNVRPPSGLRPLR